MQGTMWLFPDSREWGLGTREPRAGNRQLGNTASSQRPAESGQLIAEPPVISSEAAKSLTAMPPASMASQ